MLLSIRTTTAPATDLAYLLHKHPAKVQTFPLNFGHATVFYPEVADEACTVVLLVALDPIGLVRSRQGPSGENHALSQYVNDRPYAASSFLSVAIADVFSTAMGGRCKDRPDAVDRSLALEVHLPAIACRHGEELMQRLFQPLGYEVQATRLPLDEHFPDWGESRYFSLTLRNKIPLHLLLSHLYVLIPVIDNNKHYWIGDEEVEKLLARGAGWLAEHPEKELITHRYLRYHRSLINAAFTQLVPEVSAVETEDADVAPSDRELSLNEQLLGTVLGVLKSTGAKRVLDLGCGEGRLAKLLLEEKQFEEILAMDVSHQAIETALRNLRYDRRPDWQQKKLRFLQGSLTYSDSRLVGFDAAAIVEVIEHLDPFRLATFERAIFEFAKPKTVIITTPNKDYNSKWTSLPDGSFRHRDHRFEWTRQEFQSWSNATAERFGYGVRFLPVGPEDGEVGAPTQMGVFEL